MVILENILDKKTNKEIIKELLASAGWFIAIDVKDYSEKYNFLFNKKIHSGFSLTTFSENEYVVNEKLTQYANTIIQIILEKSTLKKVKVKRVMWNYYMKNQNGVLHRDYHDENHWSFLYTLNTTDGGLEFNNNFFPDIESEAKLFKSNILHRGIGPKKTIARFNLNVILEECK